MESLAPVTWQQTFKNKNFVQEQVNCVSQKLK